MALFLQAFKDMDISLTEPEMKVQEYRPGVNYSGYNRYAEAKVWSEDYQHVWYDRYISLIITFFAFASTFIASKAYRDEKDSYEEISIVS